MNSLLARLWRSWRLVLAVVSACSAVAALVVAAASASETIADGLERLGLNSPVALVVTIAAVTAGALLVGYLRQREEWRALLAEDPVQLGEASAYGLGVTPSSRGDEAGGTTPYVPRVVDGDLRRCLASHRFVLVVGDRASGVTRTAYEAVRASFKPRDKVLLPAESGTEPHESLGALLNTTMPLNSSLRRTVLWIDDVGARLERGEVTPGQVRTFLRRHPRASLVATMRTKQFRRLTDSRDDSTQPARGVIDLARHVVVPRTLEGEELIEARRLYPDVPESRLARLPEYLVAYDEHAERFRTADENPIGHAIVRAVLDWQRCGASRGAHVDFVRNAVPSYLPARAPVTEEQFEDGLKWATHWFVGTTALVEYDADGCLIPSPVLVEHVERGGVGILGAAWDHVIDFLWSDASELLAVATAAAGYGVTDAAKRALERASDSDEEDVATTAGGFLRQLVDARAIERGEPRLPELMRRARKRRVLDVLTSLSPEPVRADEPLDDERVFDLRAPRPAGGSAARLYRLKLLRFVLRTAALAALDAASAVAGLALALTAKALLRGDELAALFSERWSLSYWCIGFALPALATAGAYKTDSRRARMDRIALAFTAGAALVAVAGAARGEGVVYTTTAWASFVFAAPVCFGLRAAYDRISKAWVRRHGLETRVLLVGDRRSALEARARLPSAVGRPMLFVGYLSDETSDRSRDRLGSRAELVSVMRARRIHHVAIADPEISSEDVLELLDDVTLQEATASRVLSLSQMQVYNKRLPPGSTLPIQRLGPPTLSPPAAAAKRIADLVLAFVAILAAFPVILAMAVYIRLNGPGPIVVRRPRLGLGGEAFGMLKFRTVVDAGRGEQDGSSAPRPIRGAGFIRRHALDELPQFFNVLEGTMSLVGPRPLPPREYDRMQEWHRRRYLVWPGITGTWQISSRAHVVDHDETARLDLIYMHSWSLWRDFEILVRTIPNVLLRSADGPRPEPAHEPDSRSPHRQ